MTQMDIYWSFKKFKMHKLVVEEANESFDAMLASAFEEGLYIPKKRIQKALRQPEKNMKASLLATIISARLLAKAGLTFDDIKYTKNGKPIIEGGYISISHSSNMAAVVIADCEVGVDIQRLKLPSNRLVDRVCSENEKKYIQSSDIYAFTRVWCLKEAYLKMTGEGISRDLTAISFNIGEEISLDGDTNTKFILKQMGDFILALAERLG